MSKTDQTNVGFDDLRQWLEGVASTGELQHVKGAHWDLELGGLAEMQERRLGNPALLFDEIPGYPTGFRVLTNSMMSDRRIAYTLGANPESTALDIVQYWRDVSRSLPTKGVEYVNDGPVNENVLSGGDIDVTAFPAPRWHEYDGGRYIGTGCVVIMRDHDTDWINLGTYRAMVHDKNRVGLYISPGKQGRLIRDEYWDKGRPCPVAISLGQDPLLTALGGIEIPHGVSEYEVAGGIRRRATKVIKSDVTDLPYPATSEIVLEGFLHPNDQEMEGPFGEWTGYYAGGRKPAPVVTVQRIRYQNNPILYGSLTGRSPADAAYYRGIMRSAMIWDQLEEAGIPGVTGVWVHEASCARLWVNVQIDQKYAGHARQAGLIASQCHAGAYANRFVVVVDRDIDLTDSNDLIWALSTRMDPREDMIRIDNAWSTPLDPMAYPADDPRFNSRLVLDACIPWQRRDTFPRVVEPTEAYRAELAEKWGTVLPTILEV